MKKILAIAVALVMAMALSVTAFADEVLFDSGELSYSASWTTIYANGTDEALNFFEALKTEGAVVTMTSNLTEADIADASNYWLELAVQDTVGWNGDATQSIHFTQEGTASTADDGTLVYTFPAPEASALIDSGVVDTGNLSLIINYGGWTPTDVTVHFTVSIPDAAAEEPAAEEPAAEEPAASEPAAEEPAAPAETPAAPATGLALAVIPAIVAMAAAVVSKKH